MYDFLIIGSGFTGAVLAEQLKQHKKSVMIIDKRSHIGGNCYTERKHDIDVHLYGMHHFNSNNKKIWDYVNQFSKFNNYKHTIKACYQNKLYSFPINLKTFEEVYGIKTQKEAEDKLKLITCDLKGDNIEDWCLANIGPEFYNMFIKFYTQKQWGKHPKELPASIIRRIPFRTDNNNNYHKTKYYGIPIDGYTKLIENIIGNTPVELGVDFFTLDWKKYAKNLIFCGPIDQFFNYTFGKLDYRSLRWENKELNGDFQGRSAVHYTDNSVEYTRIIEHKYFNYKNQDKTIISYEYPADYNSTNEPFYPINDTKNHLLYKKYQSLLNKINNIYICGRLGTFKYINIDTAILMAMNLGKKLCN